MKDSRIIATEIILPRPKRFVREEVEMPDGKVEPVGPPRARLRTSGPRAGRGQTGVGEGLSARINYALAWHRPAIGTPNLGIAFHSTMLYN